MDNYTVPAATRIGHVHLKVSDLQRAVEFYCDLFDLKLPPATVTRQCLFQRWLSSPYRAEHLV
jgi:catechol-2,3-dioxygenase